MGHSCGFIFGEADRKKTSGDRITQNASSKSDNILTFEWLMFLANQLTTIWTFRLRNDPQSSIIDIAEQLKRKVKWNDFPDVIIIIATMPLFICHNFWDAAFSPLPLFVCCCIHWFLDYFCFMCQISFLTDCHTDCKLSLWMYSC